MPWHPLPRIAFAVALYPFVPSSPADLPLELGDELYIIEQGGKDSQWYRGYLVAPPSLLAGLTSVEGQTLEARVFSGIFPSSCVEVREVLGEEEEYGDEEVNPFSRGVSGIGTSLSSPRTPQSRTSRGRKVNGQAAGEGFTNGAAGGRSLSLSQDRSAQKPPAPVPMLKIGDETPTSISEPLVDEIASCLREWHSRYLHELLLSRQYTLLEKMSSLVQRLDLSRKQLLHNVLTAHELQSLREKTIWDLVKGNKLFSGEVIVRDPAEGGRILTCEDSVVEVTKLQSIMSLLDEAPQPPINERLTLHHLLVDVQISVGSPSQSTLLEIFLASKTVGSVARPISESYVVDVPPSGSLTDISKAEQMRTLFTDLASTDIGDQTSPDSELYIIVKVRGSQNIAVAKPSSRDRVPSREHETSRGDKSKSTSTEIPSKSGRRSLMWAQKTQRSASRRLNSFTESKVSEEGQQPPSTAGSKGPVKNEPRISSADRTVMVTHGIGALKLNAVMKHNNEVEQVITFWSPSSLPVQEVYKDEFLDVVRDLMPNKLEHFDKSRRGERLQVSLRAFEDPDVDALIKATPTLLAGVLKTNKIGFSGAPTKPRSDIYVTIHEAFLPRNALLSRATGGATPMSNSANNDLQVILEIRRANGERIDNCIFRSSNSHGESTWESAVTDRGDPWYQTFRLSLEPSDVSGAHVVILLAFLPSPPLAICYVPLWDQGAFIRDGYHSLLLYRYDDATMAPRSAVAGKGGYLALPWNARGKDDLSKDEAVTGPIATLRVETYLCSTKFSQDKVLLGLIKWKEQRPEELQDLLKRLVFVPEIEIVKLLSEVFDALFGILVEQAGNDDYEDLVFEALVTVLGIVYDRRFNLQPLVDQYAENQFNYPFATPCLVRSFTRLLASPSDPETSRSLRSTFKVVRHILKFITHARRQQKVKEADIGITTTSTAFTRNLHAIFKALDGLMRITTPILVGSQTLAVQHFHTWLPELTGLLTLEEILHIAIDFMDSCSLVKGKLVLYKLVLIINFSRLELFSRPEQKAALSANTVRWIAPHWGKIAEPSEQYRDQVRLCCSILASQIDGMGPEIPDHISKIMDSYLVLQHGPKTPKNQISTLFPTTYPFPGKQVHSNMKFDEASAELSAILSAITTLPAGMQLEMAEEEMASIIEDALHVHSSIIQSEAFPADWLSIHIYHHRSSLKRLEYLAGILLESFLPEPDDAESYNTHLWKVFFTTILKLVGSDALALETFSEQKRRAVWKIAGDVREDGAELLRKTWEAIGWDTSPEERQRYNLTRMGGYQVQYVPTLVGPIVELCLSVHEGLRRVAVEILQTMIVSEWTLSEDLSVIQTEMIDCLDNLFKSRPLTESILQKLFIDELLDLFKPLSRIEDEPLYTGLKSLVATIDEFLDLLVAVHSPDRAGAASHMIHRLRLMEFLRDMRKEEIFIRYVHQLAELQADARNHTEAGLALRLHADLYQWDPAKFVNPLSDPAFPAQTHFERKERIFFEIIKHFEDGEAWHSALDAYEELQHNYRENVFDFAKLARTQRAIATIYEKIAKSERAVPKYFMVTYKGIGFPSCLRDKQYVFEGSPVERSSAFTDRIQEMHPSAQIVTSGEVEDVEGQFLQISQISPYRELEHHVFQRSKVPHVVRDFATSSHPQIFSLTSKRNTTGPVAEHSAEKTLCTTAETFPTILKRSEIVSTERLKLGAVQTALERVIRKTQEMMAVERRVVIDGEEDVLPLLIEALNISADPLSETSVSKYRELLPTTIKDEEVQEMELQPLEKALKIALIDHAIMIKRCLTFFNKSLVVPVALHSQVEELELNFEATFAPELSSLSFPLHRPDVPRAMSTSPISVSPPSSLLLHNGEPTARTFSTMPHVSTNGTVDTSILNVSPETKRNSMLHGNSNGKTRLSLFRKSSKRSNGPLLNGLSASKSENLDEQGGDKSPAKELVHSFTHGSKRLSIFSNHSNTASHTNNTQASHLEVPQVDVEAEGDDKEWVTQSDLSRGYPGTDDGRSGTLTISTLPASISARSGNSKASFSMGAKAVVRRSSSMQRKSNSLRHISTGKTGSTIAGSREDSDASKGTVSVAKTKGAEVGVRKRMSLGIMNMGMGLGGKGKLSKKASKRGGNGALGVGVVEE